MHTRIIVRTYDGLSIALNCVAAAWLAVKMYNRGKRAAEREYDEALSDLIDALEEQKKVIT